MIMRPGYDISTRTELAVHVEANAKQSVNRVAREKHLDGYKISRMLRAASDRDNFLHNVYHHQIGKLAFEFRLHRNAVILHSVTEKFPPRATF